MSAWEIVAWVLVLWLLAAGTVALTFCWGSRANADVLEVVDAGGEVASASAVLGHGRGDGSKGELRVVVAASWSDDASDHRKQRRVAGGGSVAGVRSAGVVRRRGLRPVDE